MKRIRITHNTEYYYHTAVAFGPHRALVRPREGHDAHIESSALRTEPEAEVHWLRDTYGNSVAVLSFAAPASKLSLFSEVDVDIYEDMPIEYVVDSKARSYPFQYAAEEQIELIPYRLPSYPYDGPGLKKWLSGLYRPGHLIDTFELLHNLNTRIFEAFKYVRREEAGVQLPCQTIALGTGSCRDFAVLMMEAARHWGFGARFVTGYIQMGEGQHGATHAWTEIYIPGAGWRGFDPTNHKLAGSEHVSVGVAREHEKACPLSGAWEGPSGAFDRMEDSVQVAAL